jgi:hypothetical protein
MTVIYSTIHTTPTAVESHTSCFVRTVKYEMFVIKYIAVTNGIPMAIARGKFLKQKSSFFEAILVHFTPKHKILQHYGSDILPVWFFYFFCNVVQIVP